MTCSCIQLLQRRTAAMVDTHSLFFFYIRCRFMPIWYALSDKVKSTRESDADSVGSTSTSTKHNVPTTQCLMNVSLSLSTRTSTRALTRIWPLFSILGTHPPAARSDAPKVSSCNLTPRAGWTADQTSCVTSGWSGWCWQRHFSVSHISIEANLSSVRSCCQLHIPWTDYLRTASSCKPSLHDGFRLPQSVATSPLQREHETTEVCALSGSDGACFA